MVVDMNMDMGTDMDIFIVLIVRWNREVISNREEKKVFYTATRIWFRIKVDKLDMDITMMD